MANTVDVIEKLIQLALKNPSREEAAAAALKAVALIDQYQIPLGADVVIVRDAPYRPPTEEENQAVEDLLKNRRSPDEGPIPKSEGGPGYANSIMIQDQEFVTGQEAFRQRLVDAWRALREERKRLESEIYRFEQETHRKYYGDGIRH